MVLHLQVREEDSNKDDLIDRLSFETEVIVDPLLNVFGLTVILIFDYKLYVRIILMHLNKMKGKGHFIICKHN